MNIHDERFRTVDKRSHASAIGRRYRFAIGASAKNFNLSADLGNIVGRTGAVEIGILELDGETWLRIASCPVTDYDAYTIRQIDKRRAAQLVIPVAIKHVLSPMVVTVPRDQVDEEGGAFIVKLSRR